MPPKMARKSAPGSAQKGRKTAATAAANESPIQARKAAKGKQPAKTAADVQRMSIPTLTLTVLSMQSKPI
jgi:hypothetical protein